MYSIPLTLYYTASSPCSGKGFHHSDALDNFLAFLTDTMSVYGLRPHMDIHTRGNGNVFFYEHEKNGRTLT